MKQAISYVLAKSTSCPGGARRAGEVGIWGHDIAKLIGKVFLQKSAVNLLGWVLATPEFFWHAPDSSQAPVGSKAV
ncbi:hypothetical protein GPECTOR_415g268 [Gonium pectorale]|uniref:DUF155 domain-containing protein n=1 Tax=Gonium pectorale TaxID=33097 RepID=A0A150FV90_GONPE|nr:hypothetical protein GPECTOR_415g268 [Gonium pectorale]|eukprot:KXZ41524.1 hypothetical protein GPECTOR_415g268 [Gonium pectorale]